MNEKYLEDQPHKTLLIYQRKLEELKADLKKGLMTKNDAKELEMEIKQNFLHLDLKFDQNQSPLDSKVYKRDKRIAFFIILSMPIVALCLYFILGQPNFQNLIIQSERAKWASNQTQMIASMVARLENRLKEAPNDPQGWLMLLRSYHVLQRKDDYQKALNDAKKFFAKEPNIINQIKSFDETLRGEMNKMDVKTKNAQ